MMQGMSPTVRSVVVAVVLGVGLIAGLVYLSPSRSPSGSAGFGLAASAAADQVGRGGGLLRTGAPQALDSIGGSPTSLSALLIVLATSAVFSTVFLLFSRRAM